MKIIIRKFLGVLTLFLVNTSVSCGYVPPQSTNQNEYPNIGNAIYHDLSVGVSGITIVPHCGHAAIFYEYGSNYERRVIQANGYAGPIPGTNPRLSSDTSWEAFGGSDGYWGAYTQERVDSVATENIIWVAFNYCIGCTYAVNRGHYKDPTGYGGTPSLRCDGLVEYCYEWAFGENNYPAYNAPNEGIVPNDYGPTVWNALWPAWDGGYFTPVLQMTWINEESLSNHGTGDGHNWQDDARGLNSVPEIAVLDNTLIFNFTTSKGKEYKNEVENLSLNNKTLKREFIQINKMPPPPFAQSINSKEQLYNYKELSNTPYKEITLANSKVGSNDYVILSNDFTSPYGGAWEVGQDLVKYEMTMMVPDQSCTLKWFYACFENIDYGGGSNNKYCRFYVMSNNNGKPGSKIDSVSGYVNLGPYETAWFKIPVKNGVVFPDTFWVGHYEYENSFPTSVLCQMDGWNPSRNFYKYDTSSSWHVSDGGYLDHYQYLHEAVVAYGSGSSVDTIGKKLRITNKGLAPLKIQIDTTCFASWVKRISPSSLFIFPDDTGVVRVVAERDTFTTPQTSWFNYSYESYDTVYILSAWLRLEVSSPPVKDSTPPSVTISRPNGGELWGTGENDTIIWSMYDNNRIFNHQIEYSTNNGTSWNNISNNSNKLSSGCYYSAWDIPNIFSRNCLIRISATDSSGNCDSATSNLFTISNDTIPPLAPINITANDSNPSSWQDSTTFTIDWINPSDTSGIAGAWCKLGTAPSYSGDGFYMNIEEKPFNVDVDTFSGPQMLYIWLQDSSGNKTDSNRAFVELRYDASSPAAPESLFANDSADSSQWTIDSTFKIRYVEADSQTKGKKLIVTNKTDTSGITLALYKLGAPDSNYDTTGTANTDTFSVICTTTGGETLWVWLKDNVGNLNYNNRAYVILNYQPIGIEDKIPDKFVLFSPTPNPSMNGIVIKYGLPEKANVRLNLYDISGRLVKVLSNGTQEKGYYTVALKDNELAKGVYFLKFEAVPTSRDFGSASTGNFKSTRKLTILR